MQHVIRHKLEGKKVMILGFGREGQSSFRLIRKLLPGMNLTIADASENIASDPLLREDPSVTLFTGKGYLEHLNDYEVILKTPGITLQQLGGKIPSEKISSQTDLFLQAYSNQVIGVTGTKGKSTTATLIFHILKQAGKDALLLGNIGRPAFNYTDDIHPGTLIVFELSSHQLEFLTTAPRIAILLNLFQEHLDAYASFRDYRLAKWNIVKFQHRDDPVIFNADDPLVQELMKEFRPERRYLPFSRETELADGCFIRDHFIYYAEDCRYTPVVDLNKKIHLKGNHNRNNILAAVAACRELGLDNEEIEEGVLSFRGLEHRMEFIGKFRGIEFYDDSISTIPESCIAAVKALENVDTLIIGGFDRGVDYSGLEEFFLQSDITNLIFTGDAGRRIYSEMKNKERKGRNYFVLDRFAEFADIAFRYTASGKICLLSPAAASYDEFTNFEERGNRFKELVLQSGTRT
ncbi:MAG TPA: UDP-N-acetylmuramoyl-L-alanine--D-glutamate ligase [Bacteroidales bacterium]|nr:UDP-N-acetylmuramoyl-L-alanine--D-glutamate ligase [Bacteroidales bacterium]